MADECVSAMREWTSITIRQVARPLKAKRELTCFRLVISSYSLRQPQFILDRYRYISQMQRRSVCQMPDNPPPVLPLPCKQWKTFATWIPLTFAVVTAAPEHLSRSLLRRSRYWRRKWLI